MGECDGRVALVTGASRGIGAAIAMRLAEEGAAVAVTARSLQAHPTVVATLQDRPTLPRPLNYVVAGLPARRPTPAANLARRARCTAPRRPRCSGSRLASPPRSTTTASR